MVVNELPIAILQLENIGGSMTYLHRRSIWSYVLTDLCTRHIGHAFAHMNTDAFWTNTSTNLHVRYLFKVRPYGLPADQFAAKGPHVGDGI